MGRIYALDLLRAVAMYLGVILHASIVYQLFPRAGWPKDTYTSLWFDFGYQFLHSFRMQLFFLIAGFFAHLLLRKIGQFTFVIHRIKRVGIPFIASIFFLTPLCSLAFSYYQIKAVGMSKIEVWYQAFSMSLEWNGFFHLWFLYYLVIFYIVTMISIVLTKQMNFTFADKAIWIGTSFKNILIYTVVLAAITYLLFNGNVEPWTGIKPMINQIMYYGLFYLIGFLMFSEESLLKKINYSWVYFGTGLSISVFLFLFKINDVVLNWELLALFTSLQTVLLVFGILGVFIEYFEVDAYWVRYLSDSSYWVYLIHFPLITISQILLIESNVYGPLKFWIVLIVTTTISFMSYKYLVRGTIIGFVLNGKRH